MYPQAEEILSSLDLGSLPVVKVTLVELRVADSPRVKGENVRHVRALAETGEKLPPVVIHRPTMRVIDGMHRLWAAEMRGEREIEAQLVDGDEASVYLLAVRINVLHGLPLSLADRKAATARIIKLYPEWSDRMIAASSGISAKTVARIRRSLTDAKQQLDARTGRDGRSRPVDAAKRRQHVAKLLEENPRASLREIAQKAGVTPETVRRLRTRVAAMNTPEDAGSTGGHAPTERERQPWCRQETPSEMQQSEMRQGPVQGRASALERLRKDPAFRSTEIGRHLIRSLGDSSNLLMRHATIIENLPPHSVDWVVQAAMECARKWQTFANEARAVLRKDAERY